MVAAVLEEVRGLEEGGEIRFSLRRVPLDELLLALHEGRFTGALVVGPPLDSDRVYLKEGVVVGVVPNRHIDAQLLGGLLVEMDVLDRADVDRVLQERAPKEGLLFGQRLLRAGLVRRDELEEACREQARRRLFALYDRAEAPVLLQQGIKRLARFFPTHLDLRPVIAYGLTVCSDAARRARVISKLSTRGARLVGPYDESRNSYGLPPPVLSGLRELEQQGLLVGVPELTGLSAHETAGLLLFLDRVCLLGYT